MLSGYIFWASDIGGFEGTPEPGVYKRWVQMGLLSTHSRLHGSSSYRVPWIYGEDCSDVLRDCVKRKILLTPYLLQEALVGSENGTPVMRPLFVEFPDDRNAYSVDAQYMFGGSLLVAPVFDDEMVSFYVPRSDGDGDENGKWVSWFDHEKTYQSGQWYTETHGFGTLPLLLRPGSVTLVNPRLKSPQDNPRDGLEVLVNGTLAETKTVRVVDPENVHEVLETIRITQTGDEVVVDTTKGRTTKAKTSPVLKIPV